MLYTAWQLRAMKGKIVEITLSDWTIKKWIISVNIFNAVHLMCQLKYWTHLLVNYFDSDSDEVEIINLKVIEDFTEWEEVYVSDESVDDALKHTCKQVYIYTLKNWNHIVQHPYYYNSQSYVWFYSYKYIAKIPKEEPVEEMTMEQVCKALGKKIKIIE